MNKTFKLGFTLAEALVAMAIVGVIAALTLPPLISGTQNRKLAASLGRSVETIESGCQMLIQEASERSSKGEFWEHSNIKLSDIAAELVEDDTAIIDSDGLFKNASDYFNTSAITEAQKASYESSVRGYDGNSPSPALNSIVKNYAVNSKLGAYYGVLNYTPANPENDPENNSGNETDPITEFIYIDVNGENSPNKYGMDIYLFGLTDRCHMIPAGTERMRNLTSIPLSEDGCKESSVTNGLSCTARVVSEGYKINYKK